METISASTANLGYGKLLAKALPRVIQSEEENDRCTEMLFALEQKRALTEEERDLADLLTLLVEDFEQKHYQLPRASPREAIAFLMDQHGLKQKDLTPKYRLRGVEREARSQQGTHRVVSVHGFGFRRNSSSKHQLPIEALSSG